MVLVFLPFCFNIKKILKAHELHNRSSLSSFCPTSQGLRHAVRRDCAQDLICKSNATKLLALRVVTIWFWL